MKEGQKGAIGTGVEKRLEKNQELFGKLKKKNTKRNQGHKVEDALGLLPRRMGAK